MVPDNQVVLLNPLGGEIFKAGADTEIKWESTLSGSLDIEFSADGGLLWKPIEQNIQANKGAIQWRIPYIESLTCQIRIRPDSKVGPTTTSSNFRITESHILPRILADEEFEEWEMLSNIAYKNPEKKSDQILKVINDKERLYLFFNTDSALALQENNSIRLYMDTDNNARSGKFINGIGAEVEFRFGEREGTIYRENQIDTIGVGTLFMIISPTVWSDRFEISMNLNSKVDDKKIFSSPHIRLLIKDESTGRILPAETGGAGYQLADYEFPPIKHYSIDKKSNAHIRILSHNVEFSSFLRKDRKDAYKRLYKTLKPDIIGFSELYQDYKLDDVTSRLEEIMPSPNGRSWKAQRTADNVLATRFSIKQHSSAGPFGNGAFLLDLRPEYNNDLLVIVAHPTCCDNDSSRQDEADAMAAFIRDAKTSKGDLTISDKTPIIIVGDMNFVGDPRQVTTLLDGNIVQEDLFGEDFQPDWDGSSLNDVKPLVANLPHTFTHTGWGGPGSHANGRLDYIIYSGSVLSLENSYVFYTPALSEDIVGQYGILKEDSQMASDHLPVVADFHLKTEQEESEIYASRMNNKMGIPQDIGEVKTITGTVTACQEFGKDCSAFIENGQAGISVYGDEILGEFETGDVVSLTGILSHTYGLTQLTLNSANSNLVKHDKGVILKPHLVKIAEIREQRWNEREVLEGKLIKLQKIRILGEGRFEARTSYRITDGKDSLEIYIAADVNLVGMVIPSEWVTIIGCLGQFKIAEPYNLGYRLYPRSQRDLEIIPAIEHLSIRELRQNDKQGIPVYNDTIKRISGIVTATNQFGRNGPAFVQDCDAGVAVYGAAYVSKLSMGDSVSITGPLVVYRGMTEYIYDAEVSEVVVHKNGTVPDPQLVSISDINDQEWDGEELLEGRLVKLENVTYVEQGKFEGYNRYQVSDGKNILEIWIGNNRIFGGVQIPDGKVTIVGIVTQNKSSAPYKGGYQLLPRSVGDLSAGGQK